MKYKILAIFALFVFVMPIIAFADEVDVNETINETEEPEEILLPAAGITPDSAFYGIKRAVERIQMAFTRDEVARANLRMQFAERRLSEAREMADREKPEFVEDLMQEYTRDINQTRERIQNRYQECVEKEDETCARYADVIETVSEATIKHIAVLEEIEQKVPEQAREAIQHARERSIQGHIRTQERLEETFENIAEKGEEAQQRIARPEISDSEYNVFYVLPGIRIRETREIEDTSEEITDKNE